MPDGSEVPNEHYETVNTVVSELRLTWPRLEGNQRGMPQMQFTTGAGELDPMTLMPPRAKIRTRAQAKNREVGRMSGLVPDPLLWRRVAAFERQVEAIEATLRRMSTIRSVAPLTARLWMATLNEEFGDTTPHIAAADLLAIGGMDTRMDVNLFDPLDVFAALANGAGRVLL